MLTRDSILFSWAMVAIAILVSVAGFLATAGNPMAWTFTQWMQAIVAIGGIVLAKLGTSPLPHSEDAATVKGGQS